MKSVHQIFVFLLFSLAYAYGQMTVLSGPVKDPEVKPEQRTATIVHYERMRLTARRAIRVLALALQNTEGSTVRLNQAINNEQDIVEWANWCIQALRDKTPEGITCAFPAGLNVNDGARQESACQVAEDSHVRLNCSQRSGPAKRTESSDQATGHGQQELTR